MRTKLKSLLDGKIKTIPKPPGFDSLSISRKRGISHSNALELSSYRRTFLLIQVGFLRIDKQQCLIFFLLSMQRSMHDVCHKAGIDFSKSYEEQRPKVIEKVLKTVRTSFFDLMILEYLCLV